MGIVGAIFGGIGGFILGGPGGALAGAAAGYGAGEVADFIFSDPSSTPIAAKRIAVLGMKESGKTQFLRSLQDKPYTTYVQTAVADYETFSLKLSSGKEVKISSGKDIGGGDIFVTQYPKFAKGADAIFFVFDVHKFYQDEDYRLQTRARLQFIDESLDIAENKRAVIGSHADLFKNDTEKGNALQFAISNLQDVYKPIHNNFFLRDMRDRDQVLEICNKLLL